jgi:hypothetical protein
VVERLSLVLHSYANEVENTEISFDDELVATVKRKMNGELDWNGLLEMCMFTTEIGIGTDNDTELKCIYRMNRTKLLPTMRVLGIDLATAHWEERRHVVCDGLRLLHNFKHVLYVVAYGEKCM